MSRWLILAGLFVFANCGMADKGHLPEPGKALPGRAAAMPIHEKHYLFGTALDVRPPGTEVAYFGMGCFWGAEQHFFHLPGVVSTAVGYAGGSTPNPTYDEVSSGQTGHAEIVRVVYDPKKLSYQDLLRTFWEDHDPTQGMRQGTFQHSGIRSLEFT